jgi:peptidoglycan hydrolase CwlO-like protein
MDDVVTNKMLLEHMQGMKNDLEQQIGTLDKHVGGISMQLTSLEQKVTNLTREMREGFEASERRDKGLQEDLDETIRVQGTHSRKLARR